MIEVTSNMKEVVLRLQDKIKSLKDPEKMLQTVAIAVLPEMRKRVHIEGKDSKGGQIGTYSPSYMKVRTGNYSNADRISRGKNKGKTKNSGYFTKGQNATFDVKTQKADSKRPNYRRSSDTKVVLSLTRQMENDMSVVQTPGGYGIGYLNKFNLDKALWNEKRYGKTILTGLTSEELELVDKVAEAYVEEKLK